MANTNFLVLARMHVKSLQSCLTLRDPMDCGLPGFSVRGILQERTLECVATPSSGGHPDPGIEPASLQLLLWQAASLPLVPPGKPLVAARGV